MDIIRQTCDSTDRPKELYREPVSLANGYKRDLERYTQKVTDLKEAIKFLEENPKFEEFFRIASKLG